MSRNKFAYLDAWYNHHIDPVNRLIYFGSIESNFEEESGIDHRAAEYLIKSLAALDLAAPDGDQPITIILSNTGGEIYAGMAAFDAIQMTKNEVHILVMGPCMSMAAVLLQAADRRILSPNSTLMIHSGVSGYWGHPEDLQRWAKEQKRLDEWCDTLFLNKIRQKHPKFSKKDVSKLVQFDTFLTAKQAVEYGLADAVFGEKQK